MHGGFVLFIAAEELIGTAGIFAADQHHHDACGKGVESPSVADFLNLGESSQQGDEMEGGASRPLCRRGECRYYLKDYWFTREALFFDVAEDLLNAHLLFKACIDLKVRLGK